MKKISLYILLVSMFFVGIVETKAASADELNNLSIESISDKDNLCVYEFNENQVQDSLGFPINEEVFKYVVIQYTYNSEQNAYEPANLTLAIKDKTYSYQMYVNTLTNNGYLSSKNCGNYYISVEVSPAGDYTFVFNTNAPSNGLYYKYSSSKTSDVMKNVTVKSSESGGNSSTTKCNYNVNGKEVHLSTFFKGQTGYPTFNYFQTTDNNRIACPATYEKSNLGENYTRTQIDGDNFQCNEWKLVINQTYGSTENSNCYYYLAPANEQTQIEGSTGTIQGELVATYADYNASSSVSIRIIKNGDNTYKATLTKSNNTNSDIKISNIENADIKSLLQSGDRENYPIWINEKIEDNVTTYQFSNQKIDGATNKNYINVDKILDVVGLGEGEVYKTCRELFTTDFLEFLNNTIFRVLYIGIPILLIVLTTFDFAKVVFIDDKEGIKTAGKRFGKRIIVAILIYLIPTLLIFIGNLMGASEIEDCAKTLQQISNANKTS